MDFIRRFSLMGTILRAAPSKGYTFSTNYYACIAMPTWHRCAPPILFWPWPPSNLLMKSCLIWIFFVGPHWWVPICMPRPGKAMPFQQCICMHCNATWCRCAPPILFWHWPPFNLFPSSCSWFSSAIIIEGYHFAYSAQLSCIYCNVHMIYMCTSYFVLTLTSI